MALAEPIDRRRAMHPAVSILCWLIFALAVERAGAPMLATLAACLGLLGTMRPAVLPDMARLIKRSRWLLLSFLLLYAWSVNGAWIWPQLGGFSPTWAGLAMGAERSVRLLLMLAALALLLRYVPKDDLVYGLYRLAAPFAKLGFDRRAFAVRLSLAMEWARMERQSGGGRRGALAALESVFEQSETGPHEIRIDTRRPTWTDALALAAALAVLGFAL